MPISAKEESGARSSGPQSSDYIAVIPIKKRRFPIIRPPSPPPPLLPALPEDVCKQQDANSASAVSNSSNLTEVAARPSSLMKSEKFLVPPEKQDNVIKVSNTKQPGEMHKKLESVGKDGAGSSAVSGGSVNMAWKQRVDTSRTQDNLGKQRVEASRTQDNMRNFSLKLSLTDGQSSMLTTSGMKSDNEDSLVRANRSNWDLNTTMDNWEASISDAASVSTDSVYGTVLSNVNNFDVKPPVASTDLVGGSISGRLNLEDRKLKVVDSLYSMPLREAHTHASSLQLGLPMSSFDLKKIQISQCPAASTDSRPNVARVLSSSSNSSAGVPVIVKREPFDEPSNQKLAEVQSKELRTLSLDSKMVKPELIQKCGLEIARSSSHVTPNVVDSDLLVKTEPGLVRSHLSLTTSEETANGLNEQSLKGTKLCKKGIEVLQMSKALASESTRSSDSHVGGYLDTQVSENQVMSQDAKKISSNPESSSIRRVLEEQKVSSVENTDRIQEHNILSVGHNKSEPTGELPSSRDGEDCVSEGKIDIPAGMEHDSYDSECESDANVATTGKERREDNEYEDGELREQPINTGQEGPTCAMQIENVSNGENEHDKSERLTRPSVVSPPTGNQDGEMQLPVDMDVEEPNECSDIIPYEKIMKTAAEDAQPQESLAVETLGEFRMDSPTASRREVGPYAISNPLEGQDVEYVPGEAVDSSISSMANLAPAIYPNAEYTDHLIRYDNDEEDCSTLPEMEACLNSEIVGKDGSDVNRTRVINLSRAYNMSSPGKTRSPDRSLPVQFGRKRLPDVALEGEKPHLRGRDEVYGDDFNRFSRERNRDMFSRNPRSSYTRDRGRGHNNMCSADWEPDQDFGSSGMYNGPVEYRNARYNKYGSDYRNYGSGPNNRFSGGIGRGGRKFFNEEGSNFRDKRRPYNGRDQMVGGPRKFRDFPDDNMETFPCSRPPPYEESDGGFPIRGERNFNNKGLRRIHSKSPIRLRSRSPPGQWSSPRRRSPDGFVEQTHRRSPAMYRRGERVRSPPPGRACFQGDSMIRRQQGSPPPYMSRQMDDLREMNSGRDHHHGFGRGMMHHSRGGGSSGRGGSHRTRRYDMENSRERTRGDYFRFPMRGGGRFHDFSGEGGNNDERRRLVDKRGPARHFRPSYSGGEEKNFVYSNNTDESSRSSYRMCQEEDVYPERSNSRERQQQLERHTKNEAAAEDAAAHNSKTRRVEEEQEQEQEETFRHSDGEPNEELDDMQQSGKRKRF